MNRTTLLFLQGTSAEDFIKKSITTSSGSLRSPFEEFRRLLATKLLTELENVEIISVQDVEGGFTDVRYSVHGSPYYPSSQTDSVVALNKAEVGKKGPYIAGWVGWMGRGAASSPSTRRR